MTEAERVRFIIGSQGRTATQWLSATLSSHNEILCCHGPDFRPHDPEDVTNFRRHHENVDRFNRLSVAEYFATLERDACKTILGNIHGIDPVILVDAQHRPPFPIQACSIVRHPAAQTESLKNRFIREIEAEGSEKTREMYLAQANIHAKYFVPFVPRDSVNWNSILFCLSLKNILYFAKGAFSKSLRIYRHEDIVNPNSTALRDLIIHISDGRVVPSPAFLRQCFAALPIDSSTNNRSANTIISEWQPWQRLVFFDLLKRLDIINAYRRLGYDLRSLNDY